MELRTRHNRWMYGTFALGYGGLWYYYGWHLPVFVLICLWSSNLEHKWN